MSIHKLALIIPTKNRPVELDRLLDNIQSHEPLPHQIIVVDVSDNPRYDIPLKFNRLKIDYLHFLPPNLVKQRNEGLKMLKPEITLVGFLDDDILFHKDSIKNMIAFFEHSKDTTGGAVFNSHFKTGQERLPVLKKIFGAKKNVKKGALLKSGYTTPICPSDTTQDVEWLFGGATVWRKKVFDEIQFDSWFVGHGYLEDLDFSFRAGEKYDLFVVHNALFDHLHSSTSKICGKAFGIMTVQNRYHIVNKRARFSKATFYFDTLINLLKLLIGSAAGLNRNNAAVAAGQAIGLINCLLGKVK